MSTFDFQRLQDNRLSVVRCHGGGSLDQWILGREEQDTLLLRLLEENTRRSLIARTDPNKPPKFGAVIRAMRKEKRMPSGETADRAGISRRTLHRIETGECVTSAENLHAVAAALGSSVAEVWLRAVRGEEQ